MEFRDFLGVLRKYWVSVSLLTLLGIVGAGLYVYLAPPVYTSQATVFLSFNSASGSSELVQGTNYATSMARSYAQMATMPQVLDPVIEKLGLETNWTVLAGKISASIPTNTQLIEISVRDGEAQGSADLAQATASSLVDAIRDLSARDDNGKPVIVGTVVKPAVLPGSPTSPRLLQSIALGVVGGLALGVGLGLLRKVLDVKLHSETDVTSEIGLPVLATIPEDPTLAKDPVIMLSAPMSITGERYRQLRTMVRLFSTDTNKPRILVVTSSLLGEGKSMTAVNTAYALAEDGVRVLLIDADLRRPKVATYLNLEGNVGLTTVLLDRASLADAVQSLGRGAPDVLTAGPMPPNPAGWLGSDKMRQLLEQVSRDYHMVIIDAAPLLPVADTLSLLPFVSGVMVVAAAEQVTVPQLKEALADVERTDTQVMGIVLNKVRMRGRGAYYQYRYDADGTSSRVSNSSAQPRPRRSA